jgi:hypothetical protein
MFGRRIYLVIFSMTDCAVLFLFRSTLLHVAKKYEVNEVEIIYRHTRSARSPVAMDNDSNACSTA